MQLSCAHRIDGQLAAGNHAGWQLAGRDHASLQRICRRAQRDRGVLLGQAIVSVLCHAHGHFHTNASGNHAHAVAQKDVGKRCILLVFFGIRAVDEIHLQRDRWQIAACIKLRLRRLAHFGIALRFAFRLVAVCDLFCFRYRQMNPFRVGIGIDVRTVEIQFRQVQNISVRVLAGGHDAGDHVRFIHVIRNAGQVLFLTNGHIRVVAHALHQKRIVPVAGQLRAVFADQSVFAQHGFHGIDVFPLHVLGGAGQVRVEAEIMR